MSDENELIGAATPPPGTVPDFEHSWDARRGAHATIMIFCEVLVTGFFVVRLYARQWCAHRCLAEDLTCMLSWAAFIIYTATVWKMTCHAEGYHIWDVTKQDYKEFQRWLYASSVVYCPAAYFTKATILLLMARVFAVKERVAKSLRIYVVVLGLCYLPLQIVKTLTCLPISAYWDTSVPNARCLDLHKVFLADVGIAIITDFVILIVPIPIVWDLSFPLRRKIKIAVFLGAGGVATAVTIFRLYRLVLFLNSVDTTADFLVLDLTVTIELTIGLLCACLPSANLLRERYWSSRTSSQQDVNIPRSRSSYWSTFVAKRKKCQDRGFSLPTHLSSRRDTHVEDFDAELARFTGIPVEVDQLGTQFSTLRTCNSMDGRREGWLAPSVKEVDRAEKGGGVKAVAFSIEPDQIWDGPGASSRPARPQMGRSITMA